MPQRNLSFDLQYYFFAFIIKYSKIMKNKQILYLRIEKYLTFNEKN